MSRMTNASRVLGLFLFPALLAAPAALLAQSTQVITGQAAFTDYSKEHPGRCARSRSPICPRRTRRSP